MSNEMLIHGQMRKAIRMDMKPFSNTNIMGIITIDDSWVLFSPLPDIIGERAAYSTLYNKRVPILVEVGGKDVTMEFVRKADFLGAAIISEKHQDLRDHVVRLLMILEETGVAPASMVAADVADDPDVQNSERVHAAIIKAARALKQARETAERQEAMAKEVVALDGRVVDVETKVEEVGLTAKEAHKLAKATQGEATSFPLVKWALTRGIELDPNGDGREEGLLLSDKHLELYGKRPRKTRTEAYPNGVNVYPEKLLLRWEQHYLKRHPRVLVRLKGR